MISHKLLNGLTLFTKHIPFINSIICIFYTIIEFLHIHIHIIQFISCLSLFYIFVLYILSYLLHFCWKHRLAIHFLSVYWSLSFIDSCYKLPISDASYTLLILFIALLFIIYYFIKILYGKTINNIYNKLASTN